MENAEKRFDRAAVARRIVNRVLLPVAAILIAALGLAYARGIPVSDLLRDTSAVLDGPWYAGMFSTLGIALWAAAAAVCLLAIVAQPGGGARSLLIGGAVISLMLGADDGFLIHETIKNNVGIPSPVTIGVYGLTAVAVLLPARKHLVQRPDLGVFLIALGLLVVSVLLDAAGEAGLPTPPYSAILEDIAKFLGIAMWAAFFSSVAAGVVGAPSRSYEPSGRP